MDLRKTIAQLYEEKMRLDKVIAALEQLDEVPFPMPTISHRRGRKFMSPQERRQVSERMRRYWAERKSAEQVTIEHAMSSTASAA
jgi:hypothetical protein